MLPPEYPYIVSLLSPEQDPDISRGFVTWFITQQLPEALQEWQSRMQAALADDDADGIELLAEFQPCAKTSPKQQQLFGSCTVLTSARQKLFTHSAWTLLQESCSATFTCGQNLTMVTFLPKVCH